MTETASSPEALALASWRRLSPWSMVQLSIGSVINNVRILLYSSPAILGALSSDRQLLAWSIPVAVIVLMVISAVLGYLFFHFRISDSSIQVRKGVFRKSHLDLAFDRVQNINVEEPFYYRAIGLVTLKIDSAGSSGDEVRLVATERDTAEAISTYIREHQNSQTGTALAEGSAHTAATDAANGELFFTRSLQDLIIHGLTNNRVFIAIAGIFAFAAQANISPTDILAMLGIDFDIVVGGLSMTRLAILFVISFLMVVAVFAFLSVIVSVLSYHGYSMYRTDKRLVVRRGLLSRHQVHVEKWRIHSVALRQDWLDRLLGRYNVFLEPISHAPNSSSGTSAQFGKRILVPSVRTEEIPIVTDEILPVRIEQLLYTPAHIRLFRKNIAIASVFFLLAGAGIMLSPLPSWPLAAVGGLWILYTALSYMSYRRKGIAIDGNTIVVRSGFIGINYAVFTAEKLQRLTHMQSLLMRRRNLSTLGFQTASTCARMPHIDHRFAQSVLDFSLYRIETRDLY